MSRASPWSRSGSRSRPPPDSRCRSWSGYGCAICATDADIGRCGRLRWPPRASVLIFVAVFAVLSGVAGVGLGWLTALAGSVKIINWLTIPTATANLIHAIGGLFFSVNFYGVLQVTRAVGIVIIAIALPLLWWRFRHDDRQALTGIAWVDARRRVVRARRAAVVLLLAAGGGGPACPVATGDRGDRGVLHLDHGHLQTRWRAWHVLMAARFAGDSVRVDRVAHAESGWLPERSDTARTRLIGVSTPSPVRGAALRGPDGRVARRPGGHC